VLDFLESELEGKFFGAHLFHSDIIVTTAIRFIKDAHTGIVDWSAYPKLSELSARLEATQVFQEISQPFAAPS
jgi:glutathione S-transferase